MKTDHVIIDTRDGYWKCEHCGDKYKMNYPAPMCVVDAAMKAYLKIHRKCKKP